MPLKRLQLIPATLVCFFSACTPAKAQVQYSPAPPPPVENFTEAEPPQEHPPAPQAPAADPDVWELSDVDISDINPARKLIAFTFDDAPARTLENILAVFAAFNERNPDCRASGTLFCNGCRFTAQTPYLLHAAVALGFELGNHTQSHADLTKLSDEELRLEMDKTDALLQAVDGKARHLLRAPFGKLDDGVKQAATAPLIDWTIDTLDWTGISPDEIYDEIYGKRFSGAIVLMHDGYEHTVSALKRLLPALKADGYQVVSVSKLAKAHGCSFRRGSVYVRARKQT